MGYIKLDRCLLQKNIFKNEKLLKVWIWCLLKATHQEHKQLVGRKFVELEMGQFVFGRKVASEELNMPESTLYDYMRILQNNESINIKSDNKYSVVTVANWAIYQVQGEKSGSKSGSKWAADGQQMDTNKKVKKDKEKDLKDIYMDFVFLTKDEYQKLISQLGQTKTDEMIERLNSYGHQKAKKFKEYTSHYHTIKAWIRKDGEVPAKKPKGPALNQQRLANPEQEKKKEFIRSLYAKN